MKNNKEAVEVLRILDNALIKMHKHKRIGVYIYPHDKDITKAVHSALLALEKLDRLEKWLDERILIEDNKHKKKLKSERTGIFVSETTVKRRQLLKVLREVREVLQNEK